MAVIGNILLKKPQYYDNYKTGVLYREFASMKDVAGTEDVLRQVQAVHHLLAALNVRLDPPARTGFLTWKSLPLTQWARHRLGAKEAPFSRLALKPFMNFFSELLPGKPSADAAAPRRVPDAMKTAFLGWLAHATGLREIDISEKLGRIFEDLFADRGRVRPRGGHGTGPAIRAAVHSKDHLTTVDAPAIGCEMNQFSNPRHKTSDSNPDEFIFHLDRLRCCGAGWFRRVDTRPDPAGPAITRLV